MKITVRERFEIMTERCACTNNQLEICSGMIDEDLMLYISLRNQLTNPCSECKEREVIYAAQEVWDEFVVPILPILRHPIILCNVNDWLKKDSKRNYDTLFCPYGDDENYEYTYENCKFVIVGKNNNVEADCKECEVRCECHDQEIDTININFLFKALSFVYGHETVKTLANGLFPQNNTNSTPESNEWLEGKQYAGKYVFD